MFASCALLLSRAMLLRLAQDPLKRSAPPGGRRARVGREEHDSLSALVTSTQLLPMVPRGYVVAPTSASGRSRYRRKRWPRWRRSREARRARARPGRAPRLRRATVAIRRPARDERRDGQEELVDQTRRRECAERVRPGFEQDQAMAALPKRVERSPRIDVCLGRQRGQLCGLRDARAQPRLPVVEVRITTRRASAGCRTSIAPLPVRIASSGRSGCPRRRRSSANSEAEAGWGPAGDHVPVGELRSVPEPITTTSASARRRAMTKRSASLPAPISAFESGSPGGRPSRRARRQSS